MIVVFVTSLAGAEIPSNITSQPLTKPVPEIVMAPAGGFGAEAGVIESMTGADPAADRLSEVAELPCDLWSVPGCGLVKMVSATSLSFRVAGALKRPTSADRAAKPKGLVCSKDACGEKNPPLTTK